MASKVNHQETVKRFLDGKAVDFAVIGKLVTELGPNLAFENDPGDWICGTGPHFIHLFKLPGPGFGGNPVINVSNGAAARE